MSKFNVRQFSTSEDKVKIYDVPSDFLNQTIAQCVESDTFLEVWRDAYKDPLFGKTATSDHIFLSDGTIGFNLIFDGPSGKPFVGRDHVRAYRLADIGLNLLDVFSVRTTRFISDMDRNQRSMSIRDLATNEGIVPMTQRFPAKYERRFFQKYGRTPYDNEPLTGWETYVFRSDGRDSGSCVVNGKVFPTIRNNKFFDIANILANNIGKDLEDINFVNLDAYYWDGKKIKNVILDKTFDGEKVQHLTRKDFRNRIFTASHFRQQENVLENVLNVEHFFKRKISDKVLDVFCRQTSGVKFEIRSMSIANVKKDYLTVSGNEMPTVILSENPNEKEFTLLLSKIVLLKEDIDWGSFEKKEKFIRVNESLAR